MATAIVSVLAAGADTTATATAATGWTGTTGSGQAEAAGHWEHTGKSPDHHWHQRHTGQMVLLALPATGLGAINRESNFENSCF